MHTESHREAAEHAHGSSSTSDYLNRSIALAIEQELHHQNHVEKYVKYHRDEGDLLIAGLDDHCFIEHCEQLKKLYATITGGDGLPCVNATAPFHSKGPVLPAIKLKSLGKSVVDCCVFYAANDHWGAAWANHVLHPVVTVLLRAMKRYAVQIAQVHVSAAGISHELELRDLLERLVRFVRRVSRSWRFINSLSAHHAKEQNNFNSARDFIKYLAAKHSRLCILRIDLTFRTPAKDFSHTEAADKVLQLYLRSLASKACKRNLLPGYLGFLIKRENGISRGTHFHLMVVLNGNLQGKTDYNADYLSDRLGQMWMQRVGLEFGSFHNSYKDRASWPFNGLGLLDLHGIKALAGLRIALHYMTKQDCVLKTSNDKVKNYWRTPIANSSGKKRGPPRKFSDGLALLDRMLGGRRSKYSQGFDPTPYLLAHKQKRKLEPSYGAWDGAGLDGQVMD